MPLESRTSKINSSVTSFHSKETPENSVRERFSRGSSTIPTFMKYKKLTNEKAAGKQRDSYRNDKFQHEMGKPVRGPPWIDNEPKRLKVRGPTFSGTQSRLD